MSDDNKTVATPEEVTAKVIEEYGFNAETQGEQIEKLTNERIENQKTNSKTIEQKSGYRQQLVDKGIIDPTTFKPIGNKPDGEPIKKTNTEQSGPTMEHMALFGQGATLEEVKVAENVAKNEGITLNEAYNGDYCQHKFAQDKQTAQVKSNSLPPSGGSPAAPRAKSMNNMDESEHRAVWEEANSRATHK